jgi:hypothetical protein
MKKPSVLALSLVFSSAIAAESSLPKPFFSFLSSSGDTKTQEKSNFWSHSFSFVQDQVDRSASFFNDLFNSITPKSGESVEIIILEDVGHDPWTRSARPLVPLTTEQKQEACFKALEQFQQEKELEKEKNRLRTSLRAALGNPLKLFSFDMGEENKTMCHQLKDERLTREVSKKKMGLSCSYFDYKN